MNCSRRWKLEEDKKEAEWGGGTLRLLKGEVVEMNRRDLTKGKRRAEWQGKWIVITPLNKGGIKHRYVLSGLPRYNYWLLSFRPHSTMTPCHGVITSLRVTWPLLDKNTDARRGGRFFVCFVFQTYVLGLSNFWKNLKLFLYWDSTHAGPRSGRLLVEE